MTDLTNRSLERGITIMEIIARNGDATLAELHRESGIAKSTIRRLLGTLQARRIVRRSIADKKYRINITLNIGAGAPVPANAGLLVDVAIPVLTELTKKAGWPSDVQMIDGYAMRFIDSTRPLSPFHLFRGVLNIAINMFGSATGQVCLAGMPDDRILDYIDRAMGDERLGLERFALDRNEFFDIIGQTRERGYGVRLRQYRGETVVDDRLSAIAVPVLRFGRPFGAITLVFPRSLSTPDEMAKSHLESLFAAATQISDDLDHYGSDPQPGSGSREGKV